MADQQAHELFNQAFTLILEAYRRMGYEIEGNDNFRETAARAARAAQELVRPRNEIRGEIEELVNKTFPARFDDMVISKHNICFGLCPHHLLPVIYRASVAYIPHERVVGISKLSRLIQLLARQPTLQEDLTHELVELVYSRIQSKGAGVYIEGLHMCMAARGVGAHEARLVTSAVRGAFADQSATRQEFLGLVTATPLQLL